MCPESGHITIWTKRFEQRISHGLMAPVFCLLWPYYNFTRRPWRNHTSQSNTHGDFFYPKNICWYIYIYVYTYIQTFSCKHSQIQKWVLILVSHHYVWLTLSNIPWVICRLVGLVSYCKLVYNTYFPFSLYMNHVSFQLYDDHVGEINQPAYYPWDGVDHYNDVILSAMAYQVNGLCEGNSSVAGELPAQGSTTRKMFLFDVVMFLAW